MSEDKLTIAAGEKVKEKPTHIDEFIAYGTMRDVDNEDYARFVLHHFRLPAIMKFAFERFIYKHKLFCKYEDKEWRVIGASRLGDVWLTSDFSRSNGYDLRVMVDDCGCWSDEPFDTCDDREG